MEAVQERTDQAEAKVGLPEPGVVQQHTSMAAQELPDRAEVPVVAGAVQVVMLQ